MGRGDLGDLSLFHGRYWCDYACDPRGPFGWRYTGGMGTGALGDIGSHIIDIGEYLFGPVESVSGAALSVQIGKRPLPLGAVVGHEAVPVSDELGEVDNEDTAVFSARFRSGPTASFSVSRTAFGMPNGLAFDVYGLSGRASFDFHRPAEYLLDDAQPRPGTRGVRQIIVGPQMPYFRGGYPMQAPGVGGGNAEMFAYQARAFLDQITGAADPVPANASFADALHTMEVIQAVVRSAHAHGVRHVRNPHLFTEVPIPRTPHPHGFFRCPRNLPRHVLELLLLPRIDDLAVQLQVANIGALRALDVIENLGARKITIKCEVSGNSTRDGVVDQVHAQDGVVFKRALHTSIPLLETAPLDGIVRS